MSARTIPVPLVRANQWTIVVAVILAAVLRQPLLLLVPWIAALGGLAGGPRWQPVFRLARVAAGGRIAAGDVEMEDAAAQRFNGMLAWALLTVGLLSLLVLHAPAVGWTAAGAVALAAFSATRGFCVGCALYGWLPASARRMLAGGAGEVETESAGGAAAGGGGE